MFSTTATVPPFRLSDPPRTKDYMVENFRHIKKLDAKVKNPRADGLKPKFIPGVTKNPKYDHVQSRVAALLKGGVQSVEPKIRSVQSSTSSSSAYSRLAPVKAIPVRNSKSSESTSLSANQATKPIWGASIAANARRSKSTTDLAQKQKQTTSPVRSYSLRRRQPLKAQDESVYNWRFSDTNGPRSFEPPVPANRPSHIPAGKFMHRVEYLPCDGICAAETFPMKDEGGKDDSARSSSSSRTSRGVNTEETRIFQDPYLMKPFSTSVLSESNGTAAPRSVKITDNGDFPDVLSRNRGHERGDSGIETDFSNLAIEDNSKTNLNTGAVKNTSSQSTNMHRLGTVPRYLKERQQQWIEEADAKKEAERNADIPPGHVLMTEKERVETLKTINENYDSKIAEFNRLPVGTDTLRVRNQRIEIESDLKKLELAKKIFSRPRVFVKMDE